ncbi:ribokinase [Microbacterium sp. NPDC057407]|uniref:ribokinase n=1 Tax=Microbacterium sp. NPDC057407 TaxID=3346120 RepID=UPI00366E21B4
MNEKPATPSILVLGAINQDEIARVARHPSPGETVLADSLEQSSGGKGANQAAAAARSGFQVKVSMLGAVGDDPSGTEQLRALQTAGVDTDLVRTVTGACTGRALITVSDDGENSIIVSAGANAMVSPVEFEGAPWPQLVVGQTEVGAAPVDALARFATMSGARLVLNNAPVRRLSRRTLEQADPLVVNEHEAADVIGRSAASPIELATEVRRQTSARSVVVTLGARGSVIADDDGARTVSAVAAQVVNDTTGAGDVFVGNLAAALAHRFSLDDAVRHAATAAAVAVTWHGARAPENAAPA